MITYKATCCTYHRLISTSSPLKRTKNNGCTKKSTSSIKPKKTWFKSFLESRQENEPNAEKKEKIEGATGLGLRQNNTTADRKVESNDMTFRVTASQAMTMTMRAGWMTKRSPTVQSLTLWRQEVSKGSHSSFLQQPAAHVLYLPLVLHNARLETTTTIIQQQQQLFLLIL